MLRQWKQDSPDWDRRQYLLCNNTWRYSINIYVKDGSILDADNRVTSNHNTLKADLLQLLQTMSFDGIESSTPSPVSFYPQATSSLCCTGTTREIYSLLPILIKRLRLILLDN